MKETEKNNNIMFITGEDQEKIGQYAYVLIEKGFKVVLVPKEILSTCGLNKYDYIDFINVKVYLVPDKTDENWTLGMYTSGSTGKPKLFTFTKEQISLTLSWYKEIYPINKSTLIMTSMPVTYNFSFIAGVLLAKRYKCNFEFIKEDNVISKLKKSKNKFKSIILLANPVILDQLANFPTELSNISNIMIDSGGAPLSTSEISWFRDNGINLHEGYGLTETCSLTHFNAEVTPSTIGTCGKGFVDVKTSIKTVAGKPRIELQTPNLGTKLNAEFTKLEENTGTYLTGDLGRFKNNCLEIIGRSGDYCINGKWPKDTLEVIGEIIPTKCALVEHLSPNKVSIRFLSDISDKNKELIIENLHEYLDVPKNNILVSSNFKEVTHSLKIKRHREKKI